MVSLMTDQQTILVVEDESDLRELLRYNLEREGYSCRAVESGRAALMEIAENPPDLILLDRMLPGISGDEVITQIRRDPRTAAVPIIMLTAKAEEADELVGFALGADDYVSKPFKMKPLLARVAAVFRRRQKATPAGDKLVAGPIALDVTRYELTVHEQPISLTATEFRLLKALMSAGGRVLSRAHLIETVMGTGVAVTDRTIDVHITALRKKLNDAAGWVQTVRGIGYTFRQPS